MMNPKGQMCCNHLLEGINGQEIIRIEPKNKSLKTCKFLYREQTSRHAYYGQ